MKCHYSGLRIGGASHSTIMLHRIQGCMDLLVSHGLSSRYFITCPASQTVQLSRVDLILCPEAATLEDLAAVLSITRPGFFARLLGHSGSGQIDQSKVQKVISDLNRMLADQQVGALPALARPTIVLAPLIEPRLNSILKIAKLRGYWEIAAVSVPSDYDRVTRWLTEQGVNAMKLISDDFRRDLAITVGDNLNFVGGMSDFVVSNKTTCRRLLQLYPELSTTAPSGEPEEPIWE